MYTIIIKQFMPNQLINPTTTKKGHTSCQCSWYNWTNYSHYSLLNYIIDHLYQPKSHINIALSKRLLHTELSYNYISSKYLQKINKELLTMFLKNNGSYLKITPEFKIIFTNKKSKIKKKLKTFYLILFNQNISWNILTKSVSYSSNKLAFEMSHMFSCTTFRAIQKAF